ncbi:MAG: ABC transporter ATP-binding protein [Propionibacteriales bacterium]|nr:ABC transporter ATP-binding protein [Propionibacteriales bacterium]
MPADPSADVLEVRHLTVEYDGVAAVDDVCLAVGRGEVLALLGPSGSGKSTLLHTVAGFLAPTRGEIWLKGHRVATSQRAEPPERRDVAVVFQSYALWPHLSALDTVAYPIRRRGVGRRTARVEALDILDRLRIAHLADRRPAELSGGEQQRVGLARALARQASLYLFDEPTAHLDTQVRGVFLDELVVRREASGAGGLYATHDAEEALGLADRVALLNSGRLVQLGTPQQVYAEPIDLWAAQLTGPASVLTAKVVDAHSGGASVDLDGTVVAVESTGASAVGDAMPLLVRPGWARLGGDLTGRLRSVRFRGPHSDHVVETAAGTVLIREPGPPRHVAGTDVTWTLSRAWPLECPEVEEQRETTRSLTELPT